MGGRSREVPEAVHAEMLRLFASGGVPCTMQAQRRRVVLEKIRRRWQHCFPNSPDPNVAWMRLGAPGRTCSVSFERIYRPAPGLRRHFSYLENCKQQLWDSTNTQRGIPVGVHIPKLASTNRPFVENAGPQVVLGTQRGVEPLLVTQV